MSRQFRKVPMLVERLGGIIHAVENNRDEGERLTCPVAVAERLRQQQLSQPLLLMRTVDTQPGENGDREDPLRQVLDHVAWELVEIDLPCGKSIETRDFGDVVQKDFRHRQVLALMLKRLAAEPVIDQLDTAVELPPGMAFLQGLEPITLRKSRPCHDSPRIVAPSCFWANVSGGDCCRAFQKASCSSGLRTRVASRADATSRWAWATVIVRT